MNNLVPYDFVQDKSDVRLTSMSETAQCTGAQVMPYFDWSSLPAVPAWNGNEVHLAENQVFRNQAFGTATKTPQGTGSFTCFVAQLPVTTSGRLIATGVADPGVTMLASTSRELSFGSELSPWAGDFEQHPGVSARVASTKIIDRWLSEGSREEAYNLLLRYAARYREQAPDGFVDAVTQSYLKGESLLDLLHLLTDACLEEGVSNWPSAIARLLRSGVPSHRYAAADVLASTQDFFTRWALRMALKKEQNDTVHAVIEAALR